MFCGVGLTRVFGGACVCMKLRKRARLHLKANKRTVEGVVLKRPRRFVRSFYVLGDALVENEHHKLEAAAGLLFVEAAEVEYGQQGWAS